MSPRHSCGRTKPRVRGKAIPSLIRLDPLSALGRQASGTAFRLASNACYLAVTFASAVLRFRSPASKQVAAHPPSGYSMVTFVTFAFFSSCLGTLTVKTPPSIFAEMPSLAASFRYTPRVACHSEVSFCR